MYQNSIRPSPGWHYSHGIDEPDLPRPFFHHACQTENAQDASYHHPPFMPLPWGWHPTICHSTTLRKTKETMPLRAWHKPNDSARTLHPHGKTESRGTIHHLESFRNWEQTHRVLNIINSHFSFFNSQLDFVTLFPNEHYSTASIIFVVPNAARHGSKA